MNGDECGNAMIRIESYVSKCIVFRRSLLSKVACDVVSSSMVGHAGRRTHVLGKRQPWMHCLVF